MPGGADEVRMVGGAPGSCGHQRLGTSPHHHLTLLLQTLQVRVVDM